MNDDVSTSEDGQDAVLDEITPGAEELRALLASQPSTEEEVVAVLSRRLSGPITPDTWDAVAHSLTSYLGESGVDVLVWAALSEPRDKTRLDALEEVGGSEVAGLARRITAQFGDEMRYAFEIWGQLPDNWRLVNREVYRDLINNRYFMRIQLEKYGGEKTFVEGPPDSIMSFATFLVGALRFVGDGNAFSDEGIARFVPEAEEFLELLKSRAQEVAAGDGDSVVPNIGI